MDIASTSEKNPVHGQFVVVGGGVAGICCVEELDSIITDDSKIILITGRGGFIKTVVNPERVMFKQKTQARKLWKIFIFNLKKCTENIDFWRKNEVHELL